jgi:mRNA-degrading endonuclease RelE of RelBE toxin-antitoxin system
LKIFLEIKKNFFEQLDVLNEEINSKKEQKKKIVQENKEILSKIEKLMEEKNKLKINFKTENEIDEKIK